MQVHFRIILGYLSLFVFSLPNLIAQDIYQPFSKVKDIDSQRSQVFASRILHYQLSLEVLTDPTSVRTIGGNLSIEIETLSGNKVLELERIELLAEGYELETDKGRQQSAARKYEFFRGKVVNESDSRVGLSIINDNVHMIIHDSDGSFEISKVNDGSDLYAGFYTEEIIDKRFIPCETDTQEGSDHPVQKNEKTSRSGPLECVEIYLEIDFKAYQKKDSSIVATETWALAILSQVAIFFAESGIPITVSGIKIYTSSQADPYIGEGNTEEALNAFRDSLNNQGFTGRLAHLMSGRGLGGGRAYLNVLCNSYYNYGVSGNLSSGGTTYSTYTWNISVIAHEIGHNFGSQHTHDCAWNGDYTQIDDCGNVWAESKGYSTGSCYDTNDRILPGNAGTIMSYCHVASGASINLNNGFHPQVRDLIYARYASSDCGGSEACAGLPPSNDLCENATRLSPTFACNPIASDNLYGSNSGKLPDFTCGEISKTEDVWFVVKIPANGILTVETSTISGGLGDVVMQVYSGSCEDLIVEGCDDNSGDVDNAKININNISFANEDLLIRIAGKGGATGMFGICAYSAVLPCSDVVGDLLAFYAVAGGTNWINSDGWTDGASGAECNYCNWYGVTCDPSDNVISIELSGNNLTGNLDNSLFTLDKLESLDLSNNSLFGSIGVNFVNPINLLHLNLGDNNFQGVIPEIIALAPKLESFAASGNQLSGDLPPFSYSSKINYLDLASNNLSGCFPSPYSRFFHSGEINLLNNPNLPFSGDFYNYASDYSGFDFDRDGFCFNIDDCNDDNNTVYNGAPELCDGLDNDCDGTVDEGMENGPNLWVGPGNDGEWNADANWSLGHMPLACEDVEIGMDNATILIQQHGAQRYLSQEIKSLCIGSNTEIDIEPSFYLYVKNGYILNLGILNINSYSYFSELDTTKNGFENRGTLNISSDISLSIKKSGINGIHNMPGGIINNNGRIYIESNHPLNGNAGILNEHIINNTGKIEILGEFRVVELEQKLGAILTNSGEIIVGGEPEEEEGIGGTDQ